MPVSNKPRVKPIGTTKVVKKLVSKYWYPLLSRRFGKEDVVFLNYGYETDPPMGLPLDESDEPSRYGIQLYHETATQVDLSGKKVLEISCGHGGGAAYLMRTVHPAAYTGLDFNGEGIAFCQERHQIPGVDFVQGDAENLPFPDASFDAVLNVEASHAYPHFDRFIAEVARVLRPGGHFLYADLRGHQEFAEWDETLAEAPMQQVSKRVINPQVLLSLQKNSKRYLDLINSLPTILHPFGRLFAGVPGSLVYRELEAGRNSYRMYHFTRN
jgi:ubiquinone/menaquinone biosynthesis C-methylase UbiE